MKSSFKDTETSQSTCQAALILEHVENLLALHEELQGNKHDDLGQLIDKLENTLLAQIELRFENLDHRISRISDTLEEQKALLESGFLLGSETGALAGEPNATSGNSVDSPLRENDLETTKEGTSGEDSAFHWHRQKEAMLSKYGIDPDYRPVLRLPVDGQTEANETAENGNELDSLHESIENFSSPETEKIEQLKQELTTKLRDAEVELSINRAKLSQQKAELEASQVELERREMAIAEKYSAAKNTSLKKAGFLDRLARHLSLGKPDEPK